MPQITVDPSKLYSRTEYAKKHNIDPKTLQKRIASRDVKAITFKGGIAIIDND